MPPISFLPGPVSIAPAVRGALQQEPLSHRGQPFRDIFDRVTARLAKFTNAQHVAVLAGTGTHANDMVAAQLSTQPGRGLVLVNGEFGARLVDHAQRFGLDHETHRIPWGAAFNLAEVAAIMDQHRPAWLWATHCETSTGVLNDLDGLRAIARSQALHLCLDCIGSLGTVPLNLRDVYLASGTSGKGLGAYAGLALVLSGHVPAPHPRLPRSLDVGYHLACDGVPFTLPSNLLAALECALSAPDYGDRATSQSGALRVHLDALGYRVLAPPGIASPAVLTVPLPPDQNAGALGDWLADAGFLVSYQSRYLRERNWFQICLMGDVQDEQVGTLVEALARYPPA